MSGYYYECPSCLTVHDVNAQAHPLVWFDVDKLSPESVEILTNQLNGKGPILPIPVLGREAIGTVFPPQLPDRSCGECGKDGCIDCIPGTLCKKCQGMQPETCRPGCIACLNGWSHG